MTYYPDSFAGISLRARALAMDGHTAEAIAKRLDLHIVACQLAVAECAEQKRKFEEAMRK